MTEARERRFLFLLLGLGLVLRLAHWAALREAPFIGQLVMDSDEYDRWAVGIASGDWLGTEPFFQAPLYPYLLAVVYSLVGVGSALRLDAVYLLQIGLAVAGCYALYRAGRSLAGPRVGLAAAGLAAVYGPFLFHDVQLLKESLAVSAVSFLLWALVAGAESGRRRTWLAVGLLLGVLILLRENTFLVLPLLLPVAFLPGRERAFLRMGLVVAGIALVLFPVAMRNAAVGGGFLPTTFQGGVNFYIGNNPTADGTYEPLTPGRQMPEFERREPVRLAERATGRELTKAEVSSYWLGRSLDWAREHPVDFLALQVRKMGMYWRWYEWPDAVDYYYVASVSPVLGPPLLELGGVMLLALVGLWRVRGRLVRWSPVLLFLVGWVVSTVIFFVFSRYRLPMMPALLLLGSVTVAALAESVSERSLRTAGLGVVVVAAFVVPHLLHPGPRRDLVAYNLGILAERRGEPFRASLHFDEAIGANPEFFSAFLEGGNLARRRGDLAKAERYYRRAVEIAPGSAIAWSNLGAAWMLQGKGEAASRAFGRALELDPNDPGGLNNLAFLLAGEGHREEALALIERYLAQSPDHEPAVRLRERLRRELASTGEISQPPELPELP